MRNKIIAITAGILFCLTALPVFSDELAAVWSGLYAKADTIEEKLSVMQNIIDLHDRDMEPVITEALRGVVYSQDQSRRLDEVQRYNDLVGMMIRELGSLKAVDAAPDIYKVMKETDDEFLRATAIVGLGTAGAREYGDEIADYLRYINSDIIRITNNEQRKSVIDACILSLERLKQPAGFEPVFYASVGRYARESVKKAERALKNMIEDPTDQIIKIIRSDTTFEMRLAALGVEENSEATSERKTEAASAAIEVSLLYNSLNPSERQFQARTRIKSCEMIRDLGVASEEAVKWLGMMLNTSENINEIITSIQALGTYSSDAAVAVLTDYLSYHNERRSSGIQYKDERAIRECILSLANTGNPNGKTALMEVEFSQWSSQTIRMAKNAVKNLQE